MKDKKRIIPAVIWALVAILWVGVYKFVDYQIAMYFSNLAPKQVESDSAYSIAKLQPTAETVMIIVFVIIFLVILWQVVRNARIPLKGNEQA